MTRYGVELDTRPGFGLARSLSGLLLHASPPWVTAPCLGLPASRSPRTRQEVLADALQVAQFLAVPSECSADSTAIASHTLASVHLRLALQQTILHPTNHLDVHQRVQYLLSTVFEEVLTLEQTGGQSFVETLFAEALNDLAALWDVTRCSFECVCRVCGTLHWPLDGFHGILAYIMYCSPSLSFSVVKAVAFSSLP